MQATHVSQSPTQHPHTDDPQADLAWLGRFIAAHGGAAIGSIVSGMVGGVTTALEPYLIGAIVDNIKRGTTIDKLALDVLGLIGLTLISLVAFFGQRILSGYVAYWVNFDIRQTLFHNMLTLDQGFYQRYPTGDLIARMHSDVEMIWRLLAIFFTRIGSAVMMLIVAFILLGTINLPLTIAVFIILTIATAFQMRAGGALMPVFEKVQDQGGAISALAQDAVSGIQTIKTFGREKEVAQKFYRENMEYRRRWLYFKRRHEPVGMLPNTISESTAGIVVLFGGILAISGALTLGNFVQFLLYLTFISQVLLQLGTIYQRYQQTGGALMRLTPLLQQPGIADATNADPLPEARGEITFENAGLQIQGKWLLRNISLSIPAGKTVAFVGPTGCGKTLLVNLLARVFDPSEGVVRIDGRDVRTLKLADVRQAVAYVPQSTFLFSQALHRNVRMSRTDIDEASLARAIHISRVSNDLPQLPQGLETLVGERGVMLSGGQKQRVAIARAIVHDPAILILDDALSSVDTHTAADILTDLRQVLRTRTSLIIAHRIATIKDADYIYVMNNGQIIEQGTHAELIDLGGYYTGMVERELKEEQRNG